MRPVFFSPISGRSAGGLLAALLLALSGLVLTSLPAHACSCARQNLTQQAKRADVVFAGTLVKGSFQADTLWKGDLVSNRVKVSTPAKRCGLDLKADRRYVVFAQAKGGSLVSSRCSGTTKATKKLTRQVTKVLGDGETLGPTAGEPAKPTYTSAGTDRPATLARLAAPGIAAVIIGLLGLVVVRRRA